jgi:hypothetical protein
LHLDGRRDEVCQNADIKFIGELVQRSEQEMLKTKNFGRRLNAATLIEEAPPATPGGRAEGAAPCRTGERTARQSARLSGGAGGGGGLSDIRPSMPQGQVLLACSLNWRVFYRVVDETVQVVLVGRKSGNFLIIDRKRFIL